MNDTDLPGPGHNLPPTEGDLRQALTLAHGNLLERRDELVSALDRVPATINDDETAGRCGDFVKQVVAAVKAGEATRVAAKEPHLAAGRVIDGFFKPVLDDLGGVKRTVESRLQVYLRAKAERERQAREETERLAIAAATEAAQEAARTAEAAQTEAGLQVAIAAEEAARQAQADALKASAAAAARPAEMSRTRGDYGALANLRQEWTGEVEDRNTLDLEALRSHIPLDALAQAVRAFVRAGGRDLKGARIYERQIAVVR